MMLPFDKHSMKQIPVRVSNQRFADLSTVEWQNSNFHEQSTLERYSIDGIY